MEENKQQFNLSDFGVSEEEAKKQYSLSDFGVTEEEIKTLPSGVDATMTVGGQPEVKIEPTKQELIEKEASLATKRIEQAKANIDELGLDEQQKNLILDRYDLAMVKIQDNKLEKMRKEEDYLAKKAKEESTLMTPEQRKKRITDINLGAGEALARGAGELGLGLANIGANALEIPTNLFADKNQKVSLLSDKVNEWIIANQEGILEALDKSEQSKEGFNTAKLGELMAGMIPGLGYGKVAGANRVKSLSAVEAGTGATIEAGRAEENAQGKVVPTTKEDVVMAGATAGLATYAGAKALNSLGKLFDNMSYEAKEMIKMSDVSPEDVKFILKDVPKEKQAEVLAGALGDKFKGNINTVLKRSDELRRNVRTEISQRSKEFEKSLNMNDFDSLKYNAESMYSTLNKSLSESGYAFDATGLTDDITRLKTLTGKNDPTANMLDELEGSIQLNPNMTAEDIMNKRVQVNKLIGKYKNSGNKDAERVALQLKENIDNQIQESFPDDLKKFVGDSLDKYQIYKEQETIKNVLENKGNMNVSGKGQATEQVSYNYGKIAKDLEEEGLLTDEARQSLNLIQKMNFKYGGDFDIFRRASTKGESESGGVLGLQGFLVNMVKKPMLELLNVKAGKEYSIQDAIAKGIESSDNGVEFVRSIAVNKDLPKEVRKSLIENLGNIETRSQREANLVRAIKAQYGIK